MRIVILPSPLLGTATYRPLAAALAVRGHDSTVAPIRGRSSAEVLLGFCNEAAGADLLVPHSNAGRFAPAVGAATGAAVVFVDSLLPEAPEDPEFTSFLRALADNDGLLPGWTEWWPSAEIDALLPPSWRRAVEAEQGRWPLSFLLESPPAPSDWRHRRSGYIAFGETYLAEAGVATACGWRVARLPGSHLHHLEDPDSVADKILELAESL